MIIHHPKRLTTAVDTPLWWSFGTACRRVVIPAMLSKALDRPCLVYPLASLDVSGQWPVSHADASPNEGFLLQIRLIITLKSWIGSLGNSLDLHPAGWMKSMMSLWKPCEILTKASHCLI